MKRTTVLLVTTAFVAFAAVSLAAHQATALAGTWKLNDAASTNPNGPAPAGAGDRRGGGAAASGGGRGGGNFDATGGAAGRPNQAASELTPEEKARVNMMLRVTNKAASLLEILTDGKDIVIKQDGSGFPKQSSDGKKNVLKNPQFGEIEIKVHVDSKGLTREISTQDDLKIVESYALSADGKQLVVTIKESHPVQKIDDPKIKRVYDKQ